MIYKDMFQGDGRRENFPIVGICVHPGPLYKKRRYNFAQTQTGHRKLEIKAAVGLHRSTLLSMLRQE